MRVLIINGPNLNMLHKRKSDIYGSNSLSDIEKKSQEIAKDLNYKLSFKQFNCEGDIIDAIHDAVENFDAIIINAGAYTHTSIAIKDALEIFPKTKIEIHLSNIFKREEYRHHSMISDVVDGVICGFGAASYYLALKSLSFD